MGESSIEWTDVTWNPLRGCTEVSPGCARCYAAGVAARFSGPGQPYEGLAYRDANGRPHWTGKVATAPHKLAEPLSWRKSRMVFVNSMSDLFHEDVPEDYILSVFDVMRQCTWAGGQNCGRIGGSGHTFQVLTKRADRAADVLSRLCWDGEALNLEGRGYPHLKLTDQIWIGVSVEDQKRADERIPLLLQIPARVRFLSVEPMLGPIDLGDWDHECGDPPHGKCPVMWPDWVIVGGESGPHARPCDVAWIRSIVGQCKAAGTACYVKQLGARPYEWIGCGLAPGSIPSAALDSHLAMGGSEPDDVQHWLRPKDPKGGDIDEFPADLRVREWPDAMAKMEGD